MTPLQFRKIQDRLKASRVAKPVVETALRPPPNRHAIVLGIDPSLRGTGYGVIRASRPAPTLVTCGTIRCPAGWDHSRCLVAILQTVRELVRQHRPDVCVIEGLFYAQNLQTAIVLGEARGAALAAVAEGGLPIYEIATRKVKQAMVGYGAAQKIAVAKMVQRLLNLPAEPEHDAADALALALTHVQEQGRYSLTPLKRV